jgi:hypothetical protein
MALDVRMINESGAVGRTRTCKRKISIQTKHTPSAIATTTNFKSPDYFLDTNLLKQVFVFMFTLFLPELNLNLNFLALLQPCGVPTNFSVHLPVCMKKTT